MKRVSILLICLVVLSISAVAQELEPDAKQDAFLPKVVKGQTSAFPVGKPGIPVTRVTLKANTLLNIIGIDIMSYGENPFEPLATEGSDFVPYYYFSIVPERFTAADTDELSLTLRLNTSWFEENNVGYDALYLLHWNENSSQWVLSQPELSRNDSRWSRFTAPVTGLGNFAVGALVDEGSIPDVPAVEADKTPVEVDETSEEATETPEETTEVETVENTPENPIDETEEPVAEPVSEQEPVTVAEQEENFVGIGIFLVALIAIAVIGFVLHRMNAPKPAKKGKPKKGSSKKKS